MQVDLFIVRPAKQQSAAALQYNRTNKRQVNSLQRFPNVYMVLQAGNS